MSERVDDATLEYIVALNYPWTTSIAGLDGKERRFRIDEMAVELLSLRAIVRDVATTQPLDWEWMCCFYCRVDALPDGQDPDQFVIAHAKSCPYRRAVEWAREEGQG